MSMNRRRPGAISTSGQLVGAAVRARVHRQPGEAASKSMRRLIRIGGTCAPPLTFVAIVALWSA